MKKIIFFIIVFNMTVFYSQTALIDNMKKNIPSTSGKGKVDLLNYIAFHYFPIAPDSGLHYCNLAIDLAKKIDYQIGIANVKLQMSLNYYYANQYKNSLTSIIESLKLFEKLKYLKGVGEAYSVFAYLYNDCGEMEKAKYYALKALNVFENNKIESFAQAYCYRILGKYSLTKENYTDALTHFLKTLELMKIYGDGPAGLAYAYQELGSAYLGLNDLTNAKDCFIRAIQIADSARDSNSLAKVYIFYGQYFIKTKQYNTAVDYIKKGLAELKDLVAPSIKPKAYKYLVESYQMMGDYKNAFEAQLLLNKHQNHFAGIQRKLQIEETKIKYETDKKENQIKILTHEKEMSNLWRNVLILGILITLSFSLVILWFFRNKIKVNKELKTAQMEASEANELKTELLGVVAHDLKNPLSAILGLANLAQDEIPQKSDLSDYIRGIKDASKNMLNLITKLLDSSAIETGKIHIENVPTVLNEVVQKVIDDNLSLAEEKDQKLIFSPPDEDIVVRADFERLKQVIDNIVSNAIKYSDFSKQIHILLFKENNEAYIEVADNGPGILDSDKEKVFGKFQKLSAKPTGGEASSGLGLSIAKKLIELQNGKISFNSMAGRGTTFRVTLPLK